VKEFEDLDLIESNYKIIINGSNISTTKLTISNISQGFIIYKKLNLMNV